MKRKIKEIIKNYNEIIFYFIVVIFVYINNNITEYRHNQEIVDVSNMYIEDYNIAIKAYKHTFDAFDYSLQLNTILRDSFQIHMDTNNVKLFNQYVDSIKFSGDSAVFYSYKILKID